MRRLSRATMSLSALLVAAACSTGPAGTSTGAASTVGDAPAATSASACPASSATATATADTTASVAVLPATQAFLGTLDDTQKQSVQGERTPENLAQWSNLPDQLFERAGLRMDTLSASSRRLY